MRFYSLERVVTGLDTPEQRTIVSAQTFQSTPGKQNRHGEKWKGKRDKNKEDCN